MESIIRHSVVSDTTVTLRPKSVSQAAAAKAQDGQGAAPVPVAGKPIVNGAKHASLAERGAWTAHPAGQHAGDSVAPSAPAPAASAAPEARVAGLPDRTELDRMAAELQELRKSIHDHRTEAAEAGYAEGLQRGEAQWQEKLAHFGRLLAGVETQIEAAFTEMHAPAVEVVYEAVCKIAGESGASKDFVAGAVGQVLRRVARDLPVTVRLSPRSYALIEPFLSEGAGLLAADRITWTFDEDMLPGGCVISTPAGGLDGRMEVQLQRLRAALLASVPGGEDSA